jgi:hypothetical protein
MIKSFGTCAYWDRKGNTPSCLWPTPRLPFWASVNDGDHGDYTEAGQVRKCQACKDAADGSK